jgi:hypothetical protein
VMAWASASLAASMASRSDTSQRRSRPAGVTVSSGPASLTMVPFRPIGHQRMRHVRQRAHGCPALRTAVTRLGQWAG